MVSGKKVTIAVNKKEDTKYTQGESTNEDQIKQNHIKCNQIALSERVLLLKGGGEGGTNGEEQTEKKRKYPAEDREAKEAPRRLTAQQEEPPPKWGRHLLLAHASYKPLRTDAQPSEKHEQSIRQLINRPYLRVQADQIHYFAYRAHYQIDKANTKQVDRSIRREDSCAVDTKPPPTRSQMKDAYITRQHIQS